eukprot:TRINITY_DN11966_c0_g1_i1.p1 TRINITY_DN11966_c0_g1~~TRINITY_DN11966_c0_g1_i1.p1  ORF type:complete len:1495 (-),score=394.09 TRINITY_DN11966_c0_g1_i1:19-4503(-)
MSRSLRPQPPPKLNPYSLDSPDGHFHLSNTLGVPGFERVPSDAREDTLSAQTIKDGYFEAVDVAIKDEHGSLMEKINTLAADKRTRLFESIKELSSLRMRPQIATQSDILPAPARPLRPNFPRQQACQMMPWWDALFPRPGKPSTALRKLTSNAPFAFKDDQMLLEFAKRNAALLRAVWYIRVMQLNKSRKESERTSEWTNTITRALLTQARALIPRGGSAEEQRAKRVKTDSKPEDDPKRQMMLWSYTLRLLHWTFFEGLLDPHQFLWWLVSDFIIVHGESCGDVGALFPYLDHIARSSPLVHTLVQWCVSVLRKLPPGTQSTLQHQLIAVLAHLCWIGPDNMVTTEIPQNIFSLMLAACHRADVADAVVRVNNRTQTLRSLMHGMDHDVIQTARLSSIEEICKRPSDLVSKVDRITLDAGALIDMFHYAMTRHRADPYRASSLVMMLSHVLTSEGAKIDLQACIMDFIDAVEMDDQELENMEIFLGELCRIQYFDYSAFVQTVIARGMLYSADRLQLRHVRLALGIPLTVTFDNEFVIQEHEAQRAALLLLLQMEAEDAAAMTLASECFMQDFAISRDVGVRSYHRWAAASLMRAASYVPLGQELVSALQFLENIQDHVSLVQLLLRAVQADSPGTEDDILVACLRKHDNALNIDAVMGTAGVDEPLISCLLRVQRTTSNILYEYIGSVLSQRSPQLQSNALSVVTEAVRPMVQYYTKHSASLNIWFLMCQPDQARINAQTRDIQKLLLTKDGTMFNDLRKVYAGMNGCCATPRALACAAVSDGEIFADDVCSVIANIGLPMNLSPTTQHYPLARSVVVAVCSLILRDPLAFVKQNASVTLNRPGLDEAGYVNFATEVVRRALHLLLRLVLRGQASLQLVVNSAYSILEHSRSETSPAVIPVLRLLQVFFTPDSDPSVLQSPSDVAQLAAMRTCTRKHHHHLLLTCMLLFKLYVAPTSRSPIPLALFRSVASDATFREFCTAGRGESLGAQLKKEQSEPALRFMTAMFGSQLGWRISDQPMAPAPSMGSTPPPIGSVTSASIASAFSAHSAVSSATSSTAMEVDSASSEVEFVSISRSNVTTVGTALADALLKASTPFNSIVLGSVMILLLKKCQEAEAASAVAAAQQDSTALHRELAQLLLVRVVTRPDAVPALIDLFTALQSQIRAPLLNTLSQLLSAPPLTSPLIPRILALNPRFANETVNEQASLDALIRLFSGIMGGSLANRPPVAQAFYAAATAFQKQLEQLNEIFSKLSLEGSRHADVRQAIVLRLQLLWPLIPHVKQNPKLPSYGQLVSTLQSLLITLLHCSCESCRQSSRAARNVNVPVSNDAPPLISCTANVSLDALLEDTDAEDQTLFELVLDMFHVLILFGTPEEAKGAKPNLFENLQDQLRAVGVCEQHFARLANVMPLPMNRKLTTFGFATTYPSEKHSDDMHDPVVADATGPGHQLDPWMLLDDYPETYLYLFFDGVRVTAPPDRTFLRHRVDHFRQ